MATVAEIFERAHKAQAEYEKNASQEQVDAAVKAIGKVVYDRAEELGSARWKSPAWAWWKTRSPNARENPNVSGTA